MGRTIRLGNGTLKRKGGAIHVLSRLASGSVGV